MTMRCYKMNEKTTIKCPHCGKLLLTTDVKGYNYVCLECDENFYLCEVQKMGSFEILEEELKIICTERPEDSGSWWECDITKAELQKLKANKISCFDVMNDGRKVW